MSKFLDLTGVSNLWGKVKSRIITDINSNVTSKIGVANGIASLGSNAKLPVSQLPALKTINNNSIVGEGNISIDLSLYKIVNSLPTTNIDVNKIYLVLSEAESSSNGNVYTEYIYVNNKWEEIGKYKAKVDLTNYVTFDDVVTEYKNGVFASTDKVKFDKLFNRVIPGLAIKTIPGTFNSKDGTYNPHTHSYFIPAYVIGHTNPNTEGYLIIPVLDGGDRGEVGLMLQSDKIALDSLVEDQKDSYSVTLKLNNIDSNDSNNIIEATISENLGRFANRQKADEVKYKAIAINTYISTDDDIAEIMPRIFPVIIRNGNTDNQVLLSYNVEFRYWKTSTDGNQTSFNARANITILFDSDGNVVDKSYIYEGAIPELRDEQYNILKDLEENSYSLIADETLSYNADNLTIPVIVPGSNDIQNILINSATSTTAGVMSAADKSKIETIFNTPYVTNITSEVTSTGIDFNILYTSIDNSEHDSVSIPNASASSSGLMTAADKANLNNLSKGMTLKSTVPVNYFSVHSFEFIKPDGSISYLTPNTSTYDRHDYLVEVLGLVPKREQEYLHNLYRHTARGVKNVYINDYNELIISCTESPSLDGLRSCDYIIGCATSTKAGLLSAEMYNKLNSLNSGGSKFIIDYNNAEQIKTKLESLTISEDLFNNEFANCFLSNLDSNNTFTLLPASCLYTNLSLSDAANIVFTAHTDTQIITLRIDASVNNNRFTVNSINLETRDIVYTNEQTTNLLKQ